MNPSGVVAGLGDFLINVNETLVLDEVSALDTNVRRSVLLVFKNLFK